MQQGDTLTSTNTLADVDGMGTLSYQWQAFNGISWTAIAGAATDSLTLSPALAGYRVRMAVIYIDGFGTKENVVSGATATVNRVIGTAGADTLAGTPGADQLLGGAGDDNYTINNANDVVDENSNEGMDTVTSSVNYTIRAHIENLVLTDDALKGTGNAMGNTITGNSGNNVLMGGFGADTLIGGNGDDVLDGVTGDDASTVWMTVTSDSTAQYYAYGGAVNTVSLANSILPSVAAGQSIGFQQGGGDSLKVYVTPGTVKASVSLTLAANVENLTLTGTGSINGTGNALSNTLIGNDAPNTLDGGAGADTLSGGKGNDSYAFCLGYGADIIQENDITAGNTDTLSFGAGIANNQLWFSHTGNDLAISIVGTADKMTVQNWYLGNQYHVEQIKVSDGKVLLDTQVEALVQAMAGFTPPAMGQTTLTSAQQTALAPVLAANWH